jgi:hypothetical protein
VEPIWSSRDGERIKDNNNSGSITFQRPSETTTGRTTASTFKATVAATISEPSQVSTQDGGRCSELKESSLSTRRVKLWKSLTDLTMRIETLLWLKRTAKYNRDGRSFMLINMKMNQLRDR